MAIDASAENIGIATRHAAADPSLTRDAASAALSFRHATAEMLVQEPKGFDMVGSMEVVERVDNPAGFLRSCAELVKVCLLRRLLVQALSSSHVLFFFALCLFLAWRTSFPLYDCALASLLSPYDSGRREGFPPRRARNAYLFQIRQS